MPTYTVSLAYDVTYYGLVSVEGDTWQEAVASLTLDDWDECYEQGDHGWEQRVVRVEAEDSGDIMAEDINFNCAMIHYFPVVHRLTTIMDTCDVPDDTAAALVTLIDELRTMVQDPIFNKKESV
jgi:hypothetical protein